MTDGKKPYPLDSAYAEQGTTLPIARRTQTYLELVFDGINQISSGLTGPMFIAFNKLIQRRINDLQEAIYEDLRNGVITPDVAIAEDEMAAFIFKIHHATISGCSTRKLRMIAYYAFGTGRPEQFVADDFLSSAAMIEQLSELELKAISVLKFAIQNNTVFRDSAITSESGSNITNNEKIDKLGLFDDHQYFVSSCVSLLRFGFFNGVSGFGTIVWFASEPLFNFVERIGPAADA